MPDNAPLWRCSSCGKLVRTRDRNFAFYRRCSCNGASAATFRRIGPALRQRPRRIYCASSWRNERYPFVVSLMRAAGHEVFDFRHPDLGPGAGGAGFHWSEIDPDWRKWTPVDFRRHVWNHPLARAGVATDLAGMEWADTFVLVMPCGRSAHLEIGWAIGRGLETAILLDSGEPELMYRLCNALCTCGEELLEFLGATAPARSSERHRAARRAACAQLVEPSRSDT